MFDQSWVGKQLRQPGRWAVFALICLLVILVASYSVRTTLAGPAGAPDAQELAKIEPLVLQELTENGQTDFFIWLKAKADLSPAANLPTKEAKGQFVFDALRATAESTQQGLRTYLDGQGVTYRAYYISNKILVSGGSQELLLEVADRAEVSHITANHVYHLPDPIINPNPPKLDPSVIEPNLTFVNADDVWALGYEGTGIVLAGNDTGMQWDHPALINQYRGWNGSVANHNYNWWDATGTYTAAPGDGHGHGTHTSGTMVGDDGGTHQIGIAPDATVVHCKNIGDDGFGDDQTFTDCFEWDLAPWDLTGNNPLPNMAPDAINNSWGYPGGNQPQLEDEVNALQAAGILVEVSAGNEGPSCQTLRSPGDYQQSLTTGSVNHSGGSLPGTLTPFSSRGASPIYPAAFIPDIMAPGENINSSLPGGQYSGPTWSGTSMSGPHITGLIALMWQASPALRGDIETTVQAIIDTAVPLSTTGSNCGGNYVTGPNNDWGYGTMDALAAVNEGILQGGPNFTLEVDPEERAICTPSTTTYDVAVGQILGFVSPVTMSAVGHPAGTTATFVPNPVTPPNDTTLTIGNTAVAAAGSYSIDIIGTTATKTHTITVGLDVYTSSPGAFILVDPVDTATGISLRPDYAWTAASQAASYDIQVATDVAFTNIVYSATVTTNTHKPNVSLDPLSTYYWRVRAKNLCGTGSFTAPYSFTTRDIPPILLVDDDDNNPDVRSFYTGTLDILGYDYDLWDTEDSDANEPTEGDLDPYSVVIWFSGVTFGGTGAPKAGPGPDTEVALANWLDSGTCLFISSQDYAYDRGGVTDLMASHLGVAAITSDVGQTSVTGSGSVFSGLGPYSLVYPFSNFSDGMEADETAEIAFTGNAFIPGAAVNKETSVYRTTFWGFPFEALPTQGDRNDAMDIVIDFCGDRVATGTLAGQVTDADSSLGIEGALITADNGDSQDSTTTDANGDYEMNLALGTYTVTAQATNYVSETVTGVVIVTDTVTTQDFALQGSSLTYSPPEIEESMEIGDVVTNTVTITNTGPLPIDWSVNIGDFAGPFAPTFDPVVPLVAADKATASNTAGLNLAQPESYTPLAAGDVLDSWPVTGIPAGWGIAFDGTNVWISSPAPAWGGNTTLNEYAPDGTPTGTTYPYSWNPANGPADTTYNWNTGMIWAMDVATDDCIHEMDPASGATGETICPSFSISQRGLAYDPDTNTYLAGSWNDFTVYRFDDQGTILEQVNVGLSIAGLAYNPETMHLFVMVNAAPNPIVVLDAADNYNVVGQFNVSQDFGDFSGAGLEIDCEGNLWAIDQVVGSAYLIESGESASPCGGGDWAYAVPDSGTIAPNSSSTLDVVFDATSMYQVGDFSAELSFSGTFVNEVPTMPLTMHLSCPTCGYLDGSIFDDYTGDPLNATIEVTSTNGFAASLSGDSYSIAVLPGSYNFTVTANGYFPEAATVTAVSGITTTTDFSLTPMIAFLEYSPNSIEEFMELGEVVSNTVTVTNTGFIDLEFEVRIGGYEWPLTLRPIKTTPLNAVTPLVQPAQASAMNTAQLNLPAAESAPQLAAGDVLDSWGISGIPAGWGIALDGSNLWISSPAPAWGGNTSLNEYQTDGTATGTTYPYPWNPANGPADLTYNWNTGMIWAMDVATDDCIHEMDPASGATGETICPSFSISQRGLAYDPTTDTYLAGSWNDFTVYRFDDQGTILEQVNVGLSIAGLAYNPETMHLFVMVNAAPNPVVVLDAADNYNVVGQFNVSEGFGDFSGAGLEIDCEGNLWAIDQTTATAYLFESGETANPCNSGPEWAYAVPDTGTVPPMSSTTFEVVFDSTVVTVTGTYSAEMTLSGNFENEVEPASLIMHIAGINAVDLGGDQAKSGYMGEDVEYTFTVTNDGSDTDSFDLAVVSAWPATLSATNTGPLAAGDSFEVTVTVHIPTGLPNNSSSVATLTATSDGDPSATDSAQATTTAHLRQLFLPAVRYTVSSN